MALQITQKTRGQNAHKLRRKGIKGCCPLSARPGFNRLSASEEETLYGPLPRVTVRVRAQRLSASEEETLAAGGGCEQARGCSTPFGIRGRNTVTLPVAAVPGRQCAQRLSASEEETPEHWRDDKASSACSTPFGIRGRNTRLPCRKPSSPFRAQRLSASEEETLQLHGSV